MIPYSGDIYIYIPTILRSDEYPFASYFDVHQHTSRLTHSRYLAVPKPEVCAKLCNGRLTIYHNGTVDYKAS